MTNNSGNTTNFGMQPSAQGGASEEERATGTSMTDRPQTKQQPRSQQELQMGEKAPMPGEQAEQQPSHEAKKNDKA